MPLIKLPDRDYFAMDALSSSGIKQVLLSPAHFKCSVFNETPSMRIGTAVHAMGLGGTEEIAIFEGASTRSKAYDEWEKTLAPGARVILRDEWEQAEEIYHHLDLVPLWHSLLEDSETEIVAHDEVDGVKRKAKADILNQFARFAADLKTTSNIHEFERSIFNFGYHIQAAWYMRLFNVTRFLIVAIESAAPYSVRFFELEDDVIEYANTEIDRAMEIYRTCTETGVWPSYDHSINKVSLPRWMRRD